MTDKSTLLSESHIEDESSLRYMLKLAAPMVVTTISFTIMQFVDRYMVSRLGTEELADSAGRFCQFPAQRLRNRRYGQSEHVCKSESGQGRQEELLELFLAGDIYGIGVLSGCGGDYVAGCAVDIRDDGATAGGGRVRSDIFSNYALRSCAGGHQLVRQPILYGYTSTDYYNVRIVMRPGGQRSGELRIDFRQAGFSGDGNSRCGLGDIYRDRGCSHYKYGCVLE